MTAVFRLRRDVSTAETPAGPPTRRRRGFTMAPSSRRPSHPPAYEDSVDIKTGPVSGRDGHTTPVQRQPLLYADGKGKWNPGVEPHRGANLGQGQVRREQKAAETTKAKTGGEEEEQGGEQLPAYSCDIHEEGIFQRKLEVENAVEWAEDRHWRQVSVVLHGTALNIYSCRRDWGWGRPRKIGPDISPDNPPWIRRSGLEHSYSLLHADVGIAADYIKRHYVIRVRAETDQFLLSCVEPQTQLRWLKALFAAIDVAAPIDDRQFPRDQSVPRIQRLQWYRSRTTFARQQREQEQRRQRQEQEQRWREAEAAFRRQAPPQIRVRIPVEPVPQHSGSLRPVIEDQGEGQGVATTASAASSIPGLGTAHEGPGTIPGQPGGDDCGGGGGGGETTPHETDSSSPARPGPLPSSPARAAAVRMPYDAFTGPVSTTSSSSSSYPNTGIDPATGKWAPRCRWTPLHDVAYAQLCYAELLFRSPRRSRFVVAGGREWLVDWATGHMVCRQPPKYGDEDAEVEVEAETETEEEDE